MTAPNEIRPAAGSPQASSEANSTTPIPESLLVPLLDAAANTVARNETGSLPPVLRPLAGFDRRGLQSSTARQQLRRALEVDEGFRDRVVERFAARSEVVAALESWDVNEALRRADEAADRSDLPWLASALYAVRPSGWEFGLGVLCASFERERAEREQEADAKARELQLSTLDEARRRAETARDEAQESAKRFDEELREERRARRERELRAEHEIEDAHGRRRNAEGTAEATRAELEEARAREAKAGDRARAAEQALRDLQRKWKEQQAAASAATRAAARAAEQAALRPAPPAPPAPEPARASEPAPAPDPEPSRRQRSPVRAPVPCPPGMHRDSPQALDAMLRAKGVVLVVDGYNVSMAGWGQVQLAAQRERLAVALSRLHLQTRCSVVLVFDGAGVEGVAPTRRPGVRVVFSDADEQADPVIVRTVAELSSATPAVVATSDRWVQENAAGQGAAVVSAETLLAAIRR
jgi:predicted RNA-binding protein with PIN domain